MTKKRIDRNTNQEGNGLTDIQRTIKEYHIRRIIKEYHKVCYTYKFDYSEEMDQLLEKH